MAQGAILNDFSTEHIQILTQLSPPVGRTGSLCVILNANLFIQTLVLDPLSLRKKYALSFVRNMNEVSGTTRTGRSGRWRG
jgi:hypothetical protein